MSKETLKILDQLAAGFERAEAKADGMEARLEAKMDGMEARLEAKIDGMEAEVKADMASLKSDLAGVKKDVAKVKEDVSALRYGERKSVSISAGAKAAIAAAG